MTDNIDPRLLLCPFCGSAATLENLSKPQHERHITIGCSNENCFAYLPSVYFAREADAIAAWNRRAAADAVAQTEPVAAGDAGFLLDIERICDHLNHAPNLKIGDFRQGVADICTLAEGRTRAAPPRPDNADLVERLREARRVAASNGLVGIDLTIRDAIAALRPTEGSLHQP